MAEDTTRKLEANLPTILRNQPRASSPTCRQVRGRTAGREPDFNTKTDYEHICKLSCCKSSSYCARAFTKERNISPGSPGCYYQKEYKLKYVKGVSCVTQLSCVNPVTNVTTAAQNLPVGARLQNFWRTWLDLVAGPKVVQILKEGYTLPFRIRPNLTRSPNIIICYVNPHRNLYLLGGITSAYRQKCSRTGKLSKISGIFQPPIFSAQTQQQVDTYTRSEQFKPISQGSKIQNGDTGNHQDLPPARGVGYNRLQRRLLPHINTGTIQEISQISRPGSDIPVQGTAIHFVYSTLGVHCSSKGGETDGHTQGYKDPPVARRLVDESQIPPGLSPAHTRSSEYVSEIRLAGEFRKIITGAQVDLRFYCVNTSYPMDNC